MAVVATVVIGSTTSRGVTHTFCEHAGKLPEWIKINRDRNKMQILTDCFQAGAVEVAKLESNNLSFIALQFIVPDQAVVDTGPDI